MAGIRMAGIRLAGIRLAVAELSYCSGRMLDASTRRVPEGALELPSTARGQVAALPLQVLALLSIGPRR